MSTVSIGIELGQRTDPTAMCVAEEQERSEAGKHVAYWMIRYLERLPVGSSYPAIRERLGTLIANLKQHSPARPAVFVDATGLGKPVVDELGKAGIPITPVYFTFGDKRVKQADGSITLGKAHLVSRLQVLLQNGHLLLPKTEEAHLLAQELLDYEIKPDPDGDEKAGAFRVGSHDDLVTALGLATQPVVPPQFFFEDVPMSQPVQPARRAVGWDDVGWSKVRW